MVKHMKDLSMKIILWENNVAYLYTATVFLNDLIEKVKIMVKWAVLPTKFLFGF